MTCQGDFAAFMAKVEKIKPRHDFELCTHISLKNRYVFFQVSKVASSTIKFYLQSMEYKGSKFRVQDVNNKYLSPHLSPFQLTERILKDALMSSMYRRICFVRHPFTRLLSCYLDRIVARPNTASAKRFRKISGMEKTPSFGEFVEHVCAQDGFDMESHWRVQSDEVLFDLVSFDFIGKFENLNNDLVSMGISVFGEPFDIEGGMVDRSPTVTNAKDRTDKYYDRHLASLVARRFERDFVNFGYDLAP